MMVRSHLRSPLSETTATQEVDTCSLRWIAAGKGGKRTEKTQKKKKNSWLVSVAKVAFTMETDVVVHYLQSVGMKSIYTALARRVAITLGYEELGSNLCPRGPEARPSELRVLLSMEIPMQDGSPCTGVSAITRDVLTP